MKSLSLIALAIATSQVRALNWMPSNYWFAGDMHINTGFSQVTYQLYFYDPKTEQFQLSPVKLRTNTILHLSTLLGGIKETPYLPCCDADNVENNFLLVPNKPYIPVNPNDPSELTKFNADLKSGNKLPYVVVNRKAGIISITIIGPFNIGPLISQKLSFNTAAFETKWVTNTPWYKTLKDHSPGMVFAFSFDADKGAFARGPDALYLYGITNFNQTNGWSWTSQGNTKDAPAKDIQGMTIKKLSDQSIIEIQRPIVNLDELQEAIDFINWTGQGTFANVIPNHKSKFAQKFNQQQKKKQQQKQQQQQQQNQGNAKK